MPTTMGLAERIERLKARLIRECEQAPAGFVLAPGAIEDGVYGDPLRDRRPEFVQADDRPKDREDHGQPA